jgi:hypothetical protein
VVGEEPVEVPRAPPVEAQPQRSARERGGDPGLHRHLQVEQQIEAAPAQRQPGLQDGARATGGVHLHDLVHGGMAAHQRGRQRLQQPG